MSFSIRNQTVKEIINDSIINNYFFYQGLTGPTGPIGNIMSPINNSIIPHSGYHIGPSENIETNGIYFPHISKGKNGGLDLGSPNRPFANLWVGDINTSSNSIYLGGVHLSSDPPTNSFILPSGSSIGGNEFGTLNLNATISGEGGNINFNTNSFSVFTKKNTVPVFNINKTGNVTILSPTIDNTKGSLTVVGSSDGNFLAASNGTVVHAIGKHSGPSRIINDSARSYSVYSGRRINGTYINPTNVLSGEILLRNEGTPYVGNSQNNGFTNNGTVRIDFTTTEDQSVDNQGSQIQLWTTPAGTSTIVNNINIDSNGITFVSDGSVQNTAGIPICEKGIVNGVATLDNTGKVPLSQINTDTQDQIIELQNKVNKELQNQIIVLQSQIDTLKEQITMIFNVWNEDLFEPHIVNDMLS